MQENQIWSTSAGRWCGIPVRIHLFLYLFIVAIFGAEWNIGFPNTNLFSGTAMVTALAVLVAILLHELAHVFATHSIGGRVDEIVLMPWGGNSPAVLPHKGYTPVIAHLAGPFVNGMLFMLGLTLLNQTDNSTLSHLVNPFAPHRFSAANWQISIIEIFTWVNFQMMVVNLIPCYPFDGARLVRALIQGSEIDLPKYRIETAIKLIGNAAAFAIIGLAIFYRNYELGNIQPAWPIGMMAGIILLFAARYSLQRETTDFEEDWSEFDEFEYSSLYESSVYLDSPEEVENVAYSQWLIEKQEARIQDELLREQQEDELADEILQKLHANGGNLNCLSDEERIILDRFSERIRRRRQQSV